MGIADGHRLGLGGPFAGLLGALSALLQDENARHQPVWLGVPARGAADGRAAQLGEHRPAGGGAEGGRTERAAVHVGLAVVGAEGVRADSSRGVPTSGEVRGDAEFG